MRRYRYALAFGLTQYGYDANDNLTSVTDPRNLVTNYQYNGLGDLTQQISPDSGTTLNTFDAAGNLATRKDARNQTGTYQYDALNRVTQIAYSDQTQTFSYDQGTNGKGHLTSLSDASGSTSWSYSAQGRVLSKQQTTTSKTFTVGYGYNSSGQLTTLTTPSGQSIGYGYSNNRISSVTINGYSLLAQVKYQPFGATTGWSWGNGATTTRSYNSDGRLTSNNSAGTASYSYYADGSIQSITDDAPPLYLSGAGTTTTTINSSSNRLSSSSGVLARTYTHDAAGNITNDGTRSFTYNAAGRMSSATNAGVTTSYLYNAIGQRVRKNNASSTTYFVYDEAGHLIGEYTATGTLIQEVIWLDDIPVASIRPSGSTVGWFYIHTDHLNAPTKLTRPTDNVVVWRWDHDAYGNGMANEDPDGNGSMVNFNLRFPGQVLDAETGLNQNYFRDCYDSQTGRYCQSDPIGLQGGINTYAYVGGNPLQKIDPRGLQAAAIPAEIIGGVGIVACAVTASCREGVKDLIDRLREDPVIDPEKPIPPQLPGYVDPRDMTETTQAESCPPLREPPSPRDRCINAVALQFAACQQGGTNPLICQAKRAFGLLLCTSQSHDPPDTQH